MKRLLSLISSCDMHPAYRLKGIGLGMVSGMSLGLVADSLTYGRLKTGVDAVGMGNAGTSAAQKLGLGLGVAIFGWAIAKAGFDGSLAAQGIDQPAAVISTIRAFYNGIPMILSIILFVAFVTTFHLDRELKNLRKERTNRE